MAEPSRIVREVDLCPGYKSMAMQASLTVADPKLLLARESCYRFVSLALAEPRGGTWDELTDPTTRELVTRAADTLRDIEAAAAGPMAAGERPLAELDSAPVFARMPRSAAALNQRYEATFGLRGASKCAPFEAEYLPSKFTFQRSNMLVDITGFYNAFGLRTPSSKPDRPDHVAVECEFVAQLIRLQWQAAQSFDPLDAWHVRVCDEAVHRFLKEHLVWWVPPFAKVLAHQDHDGFYEAVAEFLAAFISAERELAGLKLPHDVVEPSALESADRCSARQLALN